MKRGAFLISCVVLVLAAAPAEAKKKQKKNRGLGPVVTVTATGNAVSADGQESIATATCPVGKQAVGGGYSVPATTASTGIFVISSVRNSAQTWTVKALHSDGSGAVTAFAYCRNKSKSISEVTATGTVPSGGAAAGGATATCPAGTQLVGGGFDITHGPGNNQFALPTTNLSTAPGSWTVLGVNNTNGAHPLTAYAYCMAGIGAPAIVSASSSPSTAQFGSLSQSSPPCPVAKKKKKGKKKKRKKKPAKLLTAGGFALQATAPIPIASQSRIQGGTWLIAGENVTGPAGVTPVTSQGICA